mmetsp:Transcript_2151/g.4316  ORF Transcript_2151/g.4316 Transcript_2151/m.4316 type:complete len:105 (+) Transcript_2151:73-387(+)
MWQAVESKGLHQPVRQAVAKAAAFRPHPLHQPSLAAVANTGVCAVEVGAGVQEHAGEMGQKAAAAGSLGASADAAVHAAPALLLRSGACNLQQAPCVGFALTLA